MEIRVGGHDSNDYDSKYQACARIAKITLSDMLFNHVQNLP